VVDGGEPGVDSRDEGKHTGRNDLLFVKKMMWMGERVYMGVLKDSLSKPTVAKQLNSGLCVQALRVPVVVAAESRIPSVVGRLSPCERPAPRGGRSSPGMWQRAVNDGH